LKKVLAIVSTLLVVVAGASPATAAPNLSSDTPVIIAHKTGPLEAPENSVQGIVSAKKKNSNLTWVEIDVNFNKSNFPVALHGSDVGVTTDGTGLVSNLWLSQTQNLNAANYDPWNRKKSDGSWQYPEYHGKVDASTDKLHLPYGYEFFDAARDANVGLLLDMQAIPTQAQAQKLYDYIIRFNYLNKTVYMGSVASVTAMEDFYPDVTTFVIEYPPAGMTRLPTTIKQIGAEGYVVRYDRLDKAVVGMYKASGLKIFTWTTDSPTTDVASCWQKMADVGVDALITNKHLEAENLIHP